MRATTHTHRFTPEEIEEMKNNTDIEDNEEILEEWARRNYPIGKGVYTIEAIETNDKGGEVSIQER
jgi:hypothetical protein